MPADAKSRFVTALAEAANDRLITGGVPWMFRKQIVEIGRGLNLPDNRIDHLATDLQERGLLREHQSHFDAMALAILYEEELDRPEFRRRNAVRREVLTAAARASDADDRLVYLEDHDQFTERPWLEVIVAVRWLAYRGYVEVEERMGHSFTLQITSRGYDVARDEAELRRTLPVTATDDEEAHAPVVRDAFRELITSCDQLLEDRGWSGALTELRRGDQKYEARDWADAVGECFSAVESGLKHRFDEASVQYRDRASLGDLARIAAGHGLIPVNYQAMFTFLESIRSPRRHGRGSSPEKVEVGPAEALLMGNHVRSLLLYLGHRPK